MARLVVIFSTIAFFISPAAAVPWSAVPASPVAKETLEIRLTRSNACKPKYKHRKSAQALRAKAHCK